MPSSSASWTVTTRSSNRCRLKLERQFDSVTELGVRNVLYHRRVLRPLQIYVCRGLR